MHYSIVERLLKTTFFSLHCTFGEVWYESLLSLVPIVFFSDVFPENPVYATASRFISPLFSCNVYDL
jgi:hypothetical protein